MAVSIGITPKIEKDSFFFITLSTLKAEAAIASVEVIAEAADFLKFRMILTFSWIILREVQSF